MPLVDLVMPKMGEIIMEATILKWLKQPGDSVKQDESLLEIATDKVDSEVPSSAEGTVEELLYEVNDVVPIGSVIARIRTNGAANGTTASAPAQSHNGNAQTSRFEQPAQRPEQAPRYEQPTQRPEQPAQQPPAASHTQGGA